MSLKMPSGYSIPTIGLGTFQCKLGEIERIIMSALEAGCRHIDTAYAYYNEEAIGRVLKRWLDEGKGTREELFISTKLPVFGMNPDYVAEYVNTSLKRLQLTYIDLYLMHVPFGIYSDSTGLAPAQYHDGRFKIDYGSDIVQVWEAMENQVDKGKVRSIGICNVNVSQIVKILATCRIKPSNVQVEMHAFHQQTELRQACTRLKIPVTACTPLGSPGTKKYMVQRYKVSPEKFPDLLHNEVVLKLAKEHKKTAAQILLRYLLQKNVIIVPKSNNPQHIKENIDINDFQLSSDHMNTLSTLDRGDDGRIIDFLFIIGIQRHNEYPFAESLERARQAAGSSKKK